MKDWSNTNLLSLKTLRNKLWWILNNTKYKTFFIENVIEDVCHKCSTDLCCMVITKIINIMNYWGPDLQLLALLICADLDLHTDLEAMLLQSSCHCPALADQLAIGRLFAVFPADLRSECKLISNRRNPRVCLKKRMSFYLPPLREKGRHFVDDVFRCNFVDEKFYILIRFSMKFVRKVPIDNNPVLV